MRALLVIGNRSSDSGVYVDGDEHEDRVNKAISALLSPYRRAPAASISLGQNLMKSVIEILAVNAPKTGVSKRSGNAYSITECECIVTRSDGTKQVGVLTLSKALEGKASPGKFEATFDINVDYRDRKIGAMVVDLLPLNAPGVAPK